MKDDITVEQLLKYVVEYKESSGKRHAVNVIRYWYHKMLTETPPVDPR